MALGSNDLSTLPLKRLPQIFYSFSAVSGNEIYSGYLGKGLFLCVSRYLEYYTTPEVSKKSCITAHLADRVWLRLLVCNALLVRSLHRIAEKEPGMDLGMPMDPPPLQDVLPVMR